MKYFTTLIKPASSSCNMKCSYCFYADVAEHREIPNHGIMSRDIMETIITKTLEHCTEETTITYAFQGGEPTLAGLSYYQHFIETVDTHKKDYHHIQYVLQTNALLLEDPWIEFLREHHFLVGVSLDGYIKNHDRVRRCSKDQGTYERVMRNTRKLQEASVEFNVLTVLTRDLSKHPKELYEFYQKNHLKYIQLIPCLPSLDPKKDPYALTPKQFYHFYDEFFTLWYNSLRKGEYMSITLFDNLIPMFIGIPPQQCGYLGFCSNQFVIESDGSVYPCDFYVLDQYCIGNIKEQSIQELNTSTTVHNFLREKRDLCKLCSDCRYVKMCHGQCRRLSVCYYDSEYCGLREFLLKYERELVEVAMNIRR